MYYIIIYIILINIIIPYLRAEEIFQKPDTKTATIRTGNPKVINEINDNYLTNHIKYNPSSKDDSSPAISSNSTILWNPNVHYRVNNSPLLVSAISHINALHTFQFPTLYLHVNCILSPTLYLHVNCILPPTLNPLNPELNLICYLLALLGAHHFPHVSRIRV